MKAGVVTLLCCVCIALPLAAQTAAPGNMASVPSGKFWMGRTQFFFFDSIDGIPRDKMDDVPANNIDLDAFDIDKYEVTNAEYARFVQATGIRAPWHWPEGQVPKGEERFPVSNVTWSEAADYCKSVGKRLPTEAEWEKAARGGLDRQRYSWGDDDLDTSERYRVEQISIRMSGTPIPAAIGLSGPKPVGSYKPNGYGIYDMIGNVVEWTSDWYDVNYYAFMPKHNPPGPASGLYKSVRGAGWTDRPGEGVLVSFRNFSDPETRSPTIGVRCAR
jgi:formylglycine-generating enzyme required for sulfatase activity